MALGFKRAGIEFLTAVDFDPNACASYEANLGKRPVHMDVRDFLRLVKSGMAYRNLDLIVADPACTPYSPAGKRLGKDDPRDVLGTTIEIIRALKPRAYLIGNVPGLETEPHQDTLRETIGSLHYDGYCVTDAITLDAADYGVPQHRRRPFWFGHLEGGCLSWPGASHGHSDDCVPVVMGERKKPWVTCRDALSHLSPDELGTPVRIRRHPSRGEPASAETEPAATVTKNTHGSGSVLKREFHNPHPTSTLDEPARTATTRAPRESGGGPHVLTLRTPRQGYSPHRESEPAKTITAKQRGMDALVFNHKHAPSEADSPARTITAKDRGGAQGGNSLLVHPRHPISRQDAPAYTLTASDGGGAKDGRVLEWPWEVPSTTIQADDRLAAPGHHDQAWMTVEAVKISERAALILQGFPEDWQLVAPSKRKRWSMLGQAMPPPLAEAVARSIVRWFAVQGTARKR
jgi:DNA-cytosine methyltransferase